MMIEPIYYSTKEFTWLPDKKEFCAEASDLVGNSPRIFGRVWGDSCDEGLILVSHKSGEEILFVQSNIQYEKDGGIVAWELRPTMLDILRNPRLENIKLIIFND